MKTLADLTAHVTTVSVLVFVITYGFGAPWWRTPIGRNIFALAIAHLMIFGLVSFNLIWGLDWAGRQIVRFLIFASVASIMAWRTVIFLKEQYRARKGDSNVE